jgi:hypothetical protein
VPQHFKQATSKRLFRALVVDYKKTHQDAHLFAQGADENSLLMPLTVVSIS